MIFEIFITVFCILLFLYIRYLYVVLADLSVEWNEEIEKIQIQQQKIIRSQNDLIKKFKSSYIKTIRDMENVKKEILRSKSKQKDHKISIPSLNPTSLSVITSVDKNNI